jgi:hypothetical protein
MSELPRRLRLLLACIGIGGVFLLGWMVGRGDSPSTPPPAPTGPAPEDVELRLDAGSLTLMPDGGLELPRLPRDPLNGEGGSLDESLDGGVETP